MAKIEYGVLLVAVAALSFTLGSSFGSTAAPQTTTVVASALDAGRLAALEHRVDALASDRPNAVAATMPPPQREAVDASAPALAETVAALHEAVLALNRSPSAGFTPLPALRPTDTSRIEGILATMPQEGFIEGSDLVMLGIPQLLDKLGRPSRAAIDRDYVTMVFRCSTGIVWVRIRDGLVFEVYAVPDRH